MAGAFLATTFLAVATCALVALPLAKFSLSFCSSTKINSSVEGAIGVFAAAFESASSLFSFLLFSVLQIRYPIHVKITRQKAIIKNEINTDKNLPYRIPSSGFPSVYVTCSVP